MTATVARFVTGEVELSPKDGIHRLRGRLTVKVSLATGNEATASIAVQARLDLLTGHDRTWIDPSFASPETVGVVRLLREAGRAASLDPIDESRRFTDAERLRESEPSLAPRQ